jgi:GT2 family glycosyltransferase
MTVRAIVIGLNEWERYTKPALESLKRTNPDMAITCVDNGSDEPYPPMTGVSFIISQKKRSYAGGINLGLQWFPDDDWYIILNNDILAEKNFTDRIVRLNPNILYGFHLWPLGTAQLSTEYISGWCMIVSKHVYKTVGLFDENCAPMWFEDADYSFRAKKAGLKLVCFDRKEWGIYHIEKERQPERRGYMEKHMQQRNEIREYLRDKHGW